MTTRSLGRARRLLVSLAVAGGVSVPGAAMAQAVYTGTPPPNVGSTDVLGVQGTGTGVQRALTTEVRGVQGVRGGLALTGGDIGGLVVIGLGAVGVGAVLTRRSRAARS